MQLDPNQPTSKMNSISTSYLLWLTWLFGMGGLHRLYNRKLFTGLLWFCTWGLFGVGQIIDILLIPDMVTDHNTRLRLRMGLTPTGMPIPQQTVEVVVKDSQPLEEPKPTKEQLMIKLLKSAQARGGKLSVTQGVLDTGLGFADVEAILKEMVKTGYVTVGNDPVTGIVMYDFVEL